MNSKTSRHGNGHDTETPVSGLAPWTLLADVGRQQLALAAVAMKTQTELLACATHCLDGSADRSLRPALQAWEGAIAAALNGAASQPRAH